MYINTLHILFSLKEFDIWLRKNTPVIYLGTHAHP